jgi:hypothetical protein
MMRPGTLLLALATVVGSAVQAQQAIRGWEVFDFAHRRLRPTQLNSLDLDDLRRLRGIVFGRHGRMFKEHDIQEWLESRPWYHRNPHFANPDLTSIERANLDVIRGAEAARHDFVELGDMRFWRDSTFRAQRLEPRSSFELRVLAAEIAATHGRRFDDDPWLQAYFDDRYWYTADSSYRPSDLTPSERQNLETIEGVIKRSRRLTLAPGDMALFENTTLTEDMLRGLGLYELRLLRNEVYARRGRLFHTPWLQRYFSEQDWYQPSPGYGEPELTAVERQNVATIVRVENRLHEALSTEPVDTDVLRGLFLEDARRLRFEIEARRGKVFPQAWLQGYFESLPWYRPNRAFTDDSLSSVEKANIAAILAHERSATKAMDAFEG